MKTTPLATGSSGKKQPPARRRVMIEVDAMLFEEVEYLLKTPDGIALFGKNTDMRSRMGKVAGAWMTNVTFGLRDGSGSRRARGLDALERGGKQ